MRQFRAQIGNKQFRTAKKTANTGRRSYQSGVSPLNRDNTQISRAPGVQYQYRQQQREARQNRFFQQRGLAVHEKLYQLPQDQMKRGDARWKRQQQIRNSNPGRTWASHQTATASTTTAAETQKIVRGRLKRNFGYMRSDIIAKKQQLIQELEQLNHQEQEQMQQLQRQQKRWQGAKEGRTKSRLAGANRSSNSNRLTNFSGSMVTVQIHNDSQSVKSDVDVVINNKKSLKKRRGLNAAQGRVDEETEVEMIQIKSSGQNVTEEALVSFDDAETDELMVTSRYPRDNSSIIDCSVLIV